MLSSGILSGLTWAAIIIGLWLLGMWLGKRRDTVAAERPDIPYKVFTDEFDIICRGRGIPELLRSDHSINQYPHTATELSQSARIVIAKSSLEAHVSQMSSWPMSSDGLAVAFLLDLSGSLADDLPEVAGYLNALVDELQAAGGSCAVYGFTTRGWRGGWAREKWLASGRPKYPGRLCALLHVVIKDFDECSDPRDWNGILRADALKENIDGEAIRWAAERLGERPEPRKWMIAVSDGAPVDDSTLQENGSGFLFRDWQAAVDSIQSGGQIELGAIGVNYSVGRVIPISASIDEPRKLSEAFVEVAHKFNSNSQQQVPMK